MTRVANWKGKTDTTIILPQHFIVMYNPLCKLECLYYDSLQNKNSKGQLFVILGGARQCQMVPGNARQWQY